jgi:glycosyltransferase 2 family protein
VKRALLFCAKLVLAAALLYLLWRRGGLNLRALQHVELDARAGVLAVSGVAAVLAGQLLMAARLRRLLIFQQVRVTFGRALGVTLIGSLSGTVLPGLISGDAVKAAYLLNGAATNRARALTAVLVDRLVGLYALFLLGGLVWIGGGIARRLPPDIPIPFVGPAVVLGLTGLGIVAAVIPLRRPRESGSALGRLAGQIEAIIAALQRYVRSPRLLGWAIALSLANHALVVFTYVAGGAILGDRLPVLSHYLVDPLAMVLNMVALTPGGLGITENAFALLFGAMGSTLGGAVALLGRVLQTAAYVLGGTAALLLTRFRVESAHPLTRDPAIPIPNRRSTIHEATRGDGAE